MLTVQRRVGESILIGEDLRLRLLEIEEDVVRIRIELLGGRRSFEFWTGFKEEFRLDDSVTAKITRTDGNRARFSINAERHIRILRSELDDRGEDLHSH